MPKKSTVPNLTEKERDALIEVRDGLRSGKFVHRDYHDRRPFKKPAFSMGTVGLFENRSCGSIGCIGGWVEHKLRRRYFAYSKAYPLCYPEVVGDWDSITPKQAANAIDNFLKDGNPRWREIVRGTAAGRR